MPVVRIRLEGETPAEVDQTLTWLRANGARITGLTHWYPKRHEPGGFVYAVLSTAPELPEQTSAAPARAQQAREKTRQAIEQGDKIMAAYWSGYADALE